MGFSGFPAETVSFLGNLKANNNTSWFLSHKADYEAFVLKPASDFIQAIGPKFKAASKKGKILPQIGGGIKRMEQGPPGNPTPYKGTLDLWFWEGEDKSFDVPGYYFRLTPDRLVIGVGLYQFSPVLAECFRAAVEDAKSGPALVKVIAGLEELALVPPRKNTLPPGVKPTHRRAELFKHDGLLAEIDVVHPKSIYSDKLVDQVLEKWLDGQPLCRWIAAHVYAPSLTATN